MDHPVTAVYDANVLYPAALRDLLIRLAQAGLVRGRWTQAIHDEWMRNVLADHPALSAERLARTRMLMNDSVRDCLVDGYEDLIGSLTLPDPDDRHVLAAAIRADAEIIVTFNLKDFPTSALASYDIEAQHPDDFVVSIFDAAPLDLSAERSGGSVKDYETRPEPPTNFSIPLRAKVWFRQSPDSGNSPICCDARMQSNAATS